MFLLGAVKVIEELINNVATAHLTTASHEISSRLISTMESLEFMLEKTSLPRPQELGEFYLSYIYE